jgi:hypothetical protein
MGISLFLMPMDLAREYSARCATLRLAQGEKFFILLLSFLFYSFFFFKTTFFLFIYFFPFLPDVVSRTTTRRIPATKWLSSKLATSNGRMCSALRFSLQ